MSLRFAILGFLSSTPGTGYEIARELAQGAGAFWQALPSQIYPELRQIEALGWIVGEQDPEDRLRRRRFRLTGEGEAALRAWVESALDYPPERDAERLQLMFLDDSPPAAIQDHLLRHRAHHEERLAVWRRMHAAVLTGTHRQHASRIGARPRAQHALVLKLKLLAIEGNLQRAQAEVDWANEALAWLDEGSHSGERDGSRSLEEVG